jgi:hypothetical protein
VEATTVFACQTLDAPHPAATAIAAALASARKMLRANMNCHLWVYGSTVMGSDLA